MAAAKKAKLHLLPADEPNARLWLSRTSVAVTSVIVALLPAPDQARCLQLCTLLRRLWLAAHQRNLWIWNATMVLDDVMLKKVRSVREVSTISCGEMTELVRGWRPLSSVYPRFCKLQKLILTGTLYRGPCLEPSTGEDVEYPSTLTSISVQSLIPGVIGWKTNVRLPPNLLVLDCQGEYGLCLSRQSLPPSLRVLRGVSPAWLFGVDGQPSDKQQVPWPANLWDISFKDPYGTVPVDMLPNTITHLGLYQYRCRSTLPESVQCLEVSLCKKANEDMNPLRWPSGLTNVAIARPYPAFLTHHANWPPHMRVLRLGCKLDDGSNETMGCQWRFLVEFRWPLSLQRLECHRFRGPKLKKLLSKLPAHWPRDLTVKQWSTAKCVVVFARPTTNRSESV